MFIINYTFNLYILCINSLLNVYTCINSLLNVYTCINSLLNVYTCIHSSLMYIHVYIVH